MTSNGASAVGVAARVLTVVIAIVLAADVARAQAAQTAPAAPAAQPAPAAPPSNRGAYVGGSVGIYAEMAEGSSGQAPAGSVIAGYQFGARWAVQGEYGWMGDLYCHQGTSQGSTVPWTYCHRDPIFSIDAVMRFKAGGVRPYVAFGLGMGVHVGAGIDIPIGRHVVIAPGVDVNMLPDMLAARPKVAVLVRF
jgi:opacity protein-like surface antigen